MTGHCYHMGYRAITGPHANIATAIVIVIAMSQYGNAKEAHEPSSSSMNSSMTCHGSAMASHEGPWHCHEPSLYVMNFSMTGHGPLPWRTMNFSMACHLMALSMVLSLRTTIYDGPWHCNGIAMNF